jgi:hypothetical protein
MTKCAAKDDIFKAKMALVVFFSNKQLLVAILKFFGKKKTTILIEIKIVVFLMNA